MKQKYYNLTAIKKLDCEYNLILGERSNGKSYAVKHECIKAALKSPADSKFILLRRWDLEIKASYINQYFADVDVELLTDGQANGIIVYNKGIYTAEVDLKGKAKRVLQIGHVRALTGSEHYKSGIYTDCSNIIYEEFISNQQYLGREPRQLQQFVSTVARRNRIKVWLIGNTISRVCPYFSEWQLTNIPKQKQGTIEIYEHQTDQTDEDGNLIKIKIAVEYSESSGTNSKMFFGTASKAITSGVWESEEKPHLPKKRDEHYNKMYDIVFEYLNFRFYCEFLTDKQNGAPLWYVQPKTSDIQPNTRVISDRPYADPYYTKGLIPLADGEKTAFKYLKDGVIFFSDNLTGSDFEVCFNKMMGRR